MRPRRPPGLPAIKNGADKGNRSPNRAIIGRVLCHLSYIGMEPGAGIEPAISHLQNERIASNVYPAKMEPLRRIERRSHPYQGCNLPLRYKGVEPKDGYDPSSERYECSIFPIRRLRHGASDRIRTGVRTLARFNISRYTTPAINGARSGSRTRMAGLEDQSLTARPTPR
jgi:hypothetical protein